MSAVIRSEFRKFFTTRLWWGMAIAVFLSGAAFAMIIGLIFTSSAMSGETPPVYARTDAALAKMVFTSGIQVGYLLTLAVGIMMIGSEYRHETITSTFLGTPRRGRVMGAKVVTLLGVGAMYGIVSLLGSVVAGTIILTARGHSAFGDPSIWRTLALSLLVLGLWALIGLGAGILIPNQVAALLISIGVAWIVEPILGVVLAIPSWGQHITPYLPSQATSATLGTVSSGFDGEAVAQLSWWAGALVLAAYAAVMAGVGTWRTVRADIS
ncbi:MAG: ABC transporter permease [Intrasporangium sp.]|uniref:ABC transporter permease n=1 Tax=Intrasporangium sp. TaxID=1925024 RepID=UPI00264804B2|nr:ABC transporter permease [Intrasporangium sp.]MDN5798112.1 ABC transporter permease [Intrasporangium sp.]